MSLPSACLDVGQLGVLSEFRTESYDCLYPRADALFELTDAGVARGRAGHLSVGADVDRRVPAWARRDVTRNGSPVRCGPCGDIVACLFGSVDGACRVDEADVAECLGVVAQGFPGGGRHFFGQ